MLRKLLLILAGAVFLCLIASGTYLYLFYDEVSKEAAERIDRGIIDSIIFSESPVYYDDGQSIVGVFFDKTHRKYIHYAEIPPLFIKALIATEDRDFFDHPGFNAKAIFRAAIANFRARKVTQGGSTITQQTAKNIFKREKKSYTAKLKELMQAILLERRYTKEEILEMYINQFFVTGFGRGLRIAAHYYFDKDVKDLDLVEVAFIAGSMKSPNSYNPFIKKSRPERLGAIRLSKVRKDYVLMNMLEMNFITKEQYLESKQKPIPFNEGKVTYRLNVALDYIRDQLDSEYFKAILQDQGIENIATSGIRIYTSLNKEIQEGALKSIRSHLPLLDVKLYGYRTNIALERYNESSDESQKKGKTDLPYLCRITEVHNDKKPATLR
jgi:membrane peptidoglycan carboxypeptidase